MISEMLIQSVGDVVRVFPAWPKDKGASFSRLRTQGGFLVSASLDNGQVTHLKVDSTVGGKLRILNPWPGNVVTVSGKETQVDSEGILTIDTLKGQTTHIDR